MKKLEVKNINKSFEDKPVLMDISIELGTGELVSLLGVSGSGKTTLENLTVACDYGAWIGWHYIRFKSCSRFYYEYCIGNWNIGKKFTYWKLKDFWVSNLNVPDMYMDSLRFFLFGGVTVWRNPADIGKVSIYDN